MPTDVMGSAAWNSSPGHDARYLAAKCNLLLGRPVLAGSLEPVYGQLLFRRPSHLWSIAPTGFGKGVSLIIPNLLAYQGSMLVVDPKGENAWVTAKWRREGLGNKVYILDPWGEVNKAYGGLAGEEETIASLNPLASLDPKAADFIGDVTYFADALVVTNPEAKEPYWDASAKDLIAGLIAFIVENSDLKGEKTLKQVRDLLNEADDTLREICKMAEGFPSGSLAKKKLPRFKGNTTEVSGVFSAARTQTIFLDSMPAQQNSDFSFDELATGRTTVYLVLPADKLRTDGRWLRLMVSMAIRAVERIRAPLDLPVVFMLDEFGTVGRLEVVEEAYGLMRGYGMAMWAFVQDLNQVSRDYPKSWQTFIANSTAVTSFGAMDEFTTEQISKMLGTSTVEYQTRSVSTGTNSSSSGSGMSYSANRSESVSFNLTGRPLLMPDEVRRLSDDLCIVLGRHNPILCRRLVYHEDYPFYRAARWDPHHGSPDQQMMAAERKTAVALAQLARQQITGFESAQQALLPCGFKVDRTRWGRIVLRRGRRQVAKFRNEREFVPQAREILAEGFRRYQFVF